MERMKDPCVDPCMTLEDATKEMRINGVAMTVEKLKRLVVRHAVPFAWGCEGERGEKASILISTHLFRQWLADFLGREPLENPRLEVDE